MGIGFDDLLNIPTGGVYGGVKAATGGYAEGADSPLDMAGEGIKDFNNVGKSKYQQNPYDYQDQHYGGYEGGANDWSQRGLTGMGASNANAAYASGQMQDSRMTDTLAGREAASRYGDQSGAIQLAREAAMGQAPSEAAYQMNAGLNQALGAQQGTAAGARGAAAIANAQGRAAGLGAGMMGQAFNAAGQLRAQEMAQARGMYGGLAGQQREQDIARIGQDQSMRLGMGQLGVGYSNSGQGWYQAAQHPQDMQLQAGLQGQEQRGNNWNQAGMINAGIDTRNSDMARKSRDEMLGFVKTGLAAGASGGGGGGMGGS